MVLLQKFLKKNNNNINNSLLYKDKEYLLKMFQLLKNYQVKNK